MTGKRFTERQLVDGEKEFNINDALYQFGVLLIDETTGLIANTLKKNFYEEYKDFDTVTAWECFVGEVNRINTVCELHDFLVDLDLNEIINENEELRKRVKELKRELFETKKDYIIETYSDNPVRRDEKLKELEKEL